MASIYFNSVMNFKGGMKCSYDKLLYPYNKKEIEETVDDGSDIFNESLYKKVLSNPQQMKYIGGISRGIGRIVAMDALGNLKGFGGLGFDGDGDFCFDYWEGQSIDFNEPYITQGKRDFSRSKRILFKLDKTTTMIKACVLDEYGSTTPYMLWSDKNQSSGRHSASAVIACVLAYIIAQGRDNSLKDAVSQMIYEHYTKVLDNLKNSNYSTMARYSRVLENDLYALFQYSKEVKARYELPIDVDLNNREIFPTLSLEEIKPVRQIIGDSLYLKGASFKEKKSGTQRLIDYVNQGKFNLFPNWSIEQKKRIPTAYDNYIPDSIVLDSAKEITQAIKEKNHVNSYIWLGDSGTGKSTSAQMLAQLIGFPYYSYNLCGDADKGDLLVSCLPNSNRISLEKYKSEIEQFPSSWEIFSDPAGAYYRLCKSEKKDASEKDVLEKEEEIRFALINNTADFIYIDSPFVKAFRDGGVIELQEVNACKPSVLKALNEALDDTAVLHLPSGESVKRNDNCVIIATANIGSGYEGIHSLSNDFLARFYQADVFEDLSEETLMQRIIDRSGYLDKAMISRMIKVYQGVRTVMMEETGSVGGCSPRQLINWAIKVRNGFDIYEAGIKTMINLASTDGEIRIKLIHALETQFAPQSKEREAI